METKEIEKMVYGHYESGLHCAEVMTKTLLEIFSEEPSIEAIRAASGFGGGIGGSTEELCGAFTGGIIVLGSLLGREKGGESLGRCGELSKAFKKEFLETFGSLNCHSLLKGFEDQKNPINCVQLTANTAAMVSNLLDESFGEYQIDLNTFQSMPRDKVQLGQCPFSACSCQE